MTHQKDDEYKSNYDKALTLFQEGNYQNALTEVDRALGIFLLDSLLNSSSRAPNIIQSTISGLALTFDQSVHQAKLHLLKARIQEPLQQEGAYYCAVMCTDSCKDLLKYASKNGMSEQQRQLKELGNEARLFAAKTRNHNKKR